MIAVKVQAGGIGGALESSGAVTGAALDTEILTRPAPSGGSTNTIRNGADADGFSANVFCGLKP